MSDIKKLVLGKNNCNRLVDMDGTVCTDIPNEDAHLFPYAQVFDKAVQRINNWYNSGDVVTFFTAREEKHRQVTETWLKEQGFLYHYLLMNKPRGMGLAYYWLDNIPVKSELFAGSWENVEG